MHIAQGFKAAVVGLLFLLPSVALVAPNAELAELIADLRERGKLKIDGEYIAMGGFIADFYERRNYVVAFDSSRIRDVMEGIEGIVAHGLNPDDYHRQVLQAKLDDSAPLAAAARAEVDLLLMDAFLRMAADRWYGKVNPSTLNPNWNFARPLAVADSIDELTRAVGSSSPMQHLDSLLPEAPFYRNLKMGLARYRAIAEHGGWQEVESGPSLRLGMADARVPALRERLRVTGDLVSTSAPDPSRFDDELKQAVEVFQRRHGLDVDGVVGPATLAAMNVPVASRIDQIRVNLERARWVQRDLPSEFVLVDIAGFQVYLVREGQIAWSARAQVGKEYRQTPVFRATIDHVVLNPTWTVPPTILRVDIIPQARRNPDIIRQKGLRVLDLEGREIDPQEVDWLAGHVPYILRQDPGPNNALGRVKIMSPNEHHVYLHDTPHQELFERSARATSSGCIRVERPLELTELLLEGIGSEGWSRARIEEVIATRRTTRVNLNRTVPLLFLYWTADTMEGVTVTFRDDLYNRDAPLLRALDRKPGLASSELSAAPSVSIVDNTAKKL